MFSQMGSPEKLLQVDFGVIDFENLKDIAVNEGMGRSLWAFMCVWEYLYNSEYHAAPESDSGSRQTVLCAQTLVLRVPMTILFERSEERK